MNFLDKFKKIFPFIFSIFLYTFLVKSQGTSLQIFCDAGGPYVRTATVLVVGNVTNITSQKGEEANLSIKIQKDGDILAEKNLTSSLNGTFYSIFTQDFGIGNYTLNVTAEKGGEQVTCLDEFRILLSQPLVCEDKLLKIEGRAIYSSTGESVTSGKVYAIVAETLDRNSTTFSNGQFSFYLKACLVLGKRYTLGITVEDNQGKKGSYQTIFLAV